MLRVSATHPPVETRTKHKDLAAGRSDPVLAAFYFPLRLRLVRTWVFLTSDRHLPLLTPSLVGPVQLLKTGPVNDQNGTITVPLYLGI